MNTPRRKQSQGRRRNSQKAKPVDLWRPVPPLSELQPIRPVSDPTALVRSLGDPPLPSQDQAALASLVLVVNRAARLATGLAASADLLEMPSSADDPDDD